MEEEEEPRCRPSPGTHMVPGQGRVPPTHPLRLEQLLLQFGPPRGSHCPLPPKASLGAAQQRVVTEKCCPPQTCQSQGHTGAVRGELQCPGEQGQWGGGWGDGWVSVSVDKLQNLHLPLPQGQTLLVLGRPHWQHQQCPTSCCPLPPSLCAHGAAGSPRPTLCPLLPQGAAPGP